MSQCKGFALSKMLKDIFAPPSKMRTTTLQIGALLLQRTSAMGNAAKQHPVTANGGNGPVTSGRTTMVRKFAWSASCALPPLSSTSVAPAKRNSSPFHATTAEIVRIPRDEAIRIDCNRAGSSQR
jgi:hypothetical protein